MTPGASPSSGCSFGQHMVSQTPVFDNAVRKRGPDRPNQVMSRKGIIRRDKRKKAKFL
jgi:hypothetical protein